jgi:hypothetical protein
MAHVQIFINGDIVNTYQRRAMTKTVTTLRKIFAIIVYIFAAIGFILIVVYAAVELGWTKTSGIIDNQHDYFKNQVLDSKNETGNASSTENVSSSSQADWIQSPQWQTLKEAIRKDEESINQAATVAGVPARMIVAPLVVEQLRLFYSDREVFKEIFAPLKVLGNQSQFSWGVMGIKQDTALEIENNLKNPQSPFYLGSPYEHLLDFPASSTSPDEQRFDRLTDDTNRYYSYLYAGLMIRELEAQWKNTGFSIDNRQDIIATLFNIGFENSHPNANPQVGGAEIDIGSSTYSFGGLAESFYASDEMNDVFPK